LRDHEEEQMSEIPRDGRAAVERNDIIELLVNSQAELQSALGIYRMGRERRDFDPYVERRMQASLAMQHELLDALGRPMYQPAQMPDGWTPA
jgi:hypothetical protein